MRGGDTPTLGVTRKTPAPWDSGPTREGVPSLQTSPHLASSALMNAKPVVKGQIFYQPRSGMVMQNCRSKKKKSVTFAFFDVVASVLADFRCFQLVLAKYEIFC